MGRFIDLTGKRFGRLVVLKEISERKYQCICWLCQCDCGKEIITLGKTLKNGGTQSCGCLFIEKRDESRYSHHMTKTRIHKIWCGIKQRTQNPNKPAYYRYGKRGIILCSRWQKFINFYEDMKDGYTDNLTIERIDNNKGYSKENCRWATSKEQNSNTRQNRYITFKNKTQIISDWARELGFKRETLRNRIDKYGWSIEKALTTPIK